MNEHRFYNEYILPVLEEIKEEFKKRGVETNINDRTLTVKGIEAEEIILSYEYHMAKFWVDNDYHHLFSNIFDGRRTTELIFAPIKPKSIYDLEIGDAYFSISSDGNLLRRQIRTTECMARYYKTLANGYVFLTEEECNKAIAKNQAIAKIKKRAHELQGDWKPDWDSESEAKVYIEYRHDQKKLSALVLYTFQAQNICLKSMKIAIQIIEELHEECKLMLEVE